MLWLRMVRLQAGIGRIVGGLNAQIESQYGPIAEGVAAAAYSTHLQMALPTAALAAAVGAQANTIIAALGAAQTPVTAAVRAVHDAVYLDLAGQINNLSAALHGGAVG